MHALVRENAPSGIKASNFMGGIHPRLKRPVGRRLAISYMGLIAGGAVTGPEGQRQKVSTQ